MALRKSVKTSIAFCLVLGLSGCGLLPEVYVWLNKVDFEVDPHANRRTPFACHIVVAYSRDLKDKLQGMDSRGYFTNIESIEKIYKDSVQIFKFDIIPGKNKLNQKIDIRSRFKAQGAYIFAKYSTPGKFMENVGNSRSLVVRFMPYKMEIVSDMSFDKLKKMLDQGNLEGLGNLGNLGIG
ncbi:MAG: hypothetical protein LBF70_00580 [Holosporales bacterium]|nr:hypothetical protein [Holosporales bacterium]